MIVRVLINYLLGPLTLLNFFFKSSPPIHFSATHSNYFQYLPGCNLLSSLWYIIVDIPFIFHIKGKIYMSKECKHIISPYIPMTLF